MDTHWRRYAPSRHVAAHQEHHKPLLWKGLRQMSPHFHSDSRRKTCPIILTHCRDKGYDDSTGPVREDGRKPRFCVTCVITNGSVDDSVLRPPRWAPKEVLTRRSRKQIVGRTSGPSRLVGRTSGPSRLVGRTFGPSRRTRGPSYEHARTARRCSRTKTLTRISHGKVMPSCSPGGVREEPLGSRPLHPVRKTRGFRRRSA